MANKVIEVCIFLVKIKFSEKENNFPNLLYPSMVNYSALRLKARKTQNKREFHDIILHSMSVPYQ